MNLQSFQVKFVNDFKKALLQENHKVFIKTFTIRLLKNKEFFTFFKKRLRIYARYKKEQKTLIDKLLACSSEKEIVLLLSECDSSYKLFYNLVYSYLQWKDNFSLENFSSKKYHDSKQNLTSRLEKLIIKQPYKIALITWGSFLTRRKVFSLFSDVDCVIVIDDRKLIQNYKLVPFILSLFKEIGVSHYNLPTKKEIEWFESSEGIARCGIIKEGIFINFKIVTKQALFNSICKFNTEFLKESNKTLILIPDFNGVNRIFFANKAIPVYPYVKINSTYKICRGLVPELLCTGHIMACTDHLLKEKISDIQKDCIAKSIGYLKVYNLTVEQKDLPSKLLNLSYTPVSEMDNQRKQYLLKFYKKICEKVDSKTYTESFLRRIHGEIVLPLFESQYWAHKNLLAFSLGCSGKYNRKSLIYYYKKIKDFHKDIEEKYLNLIIKDIANSDVFLKISLTKKEKILLATSVIDIVEPFCTDRPIFYKIVEKTFQNVFPKEYGVAFNKLEKLLSGIDGSEKLEILVRNIEKDLKDLDKFIIKIRYRVRQPAGLYQHHLMKNIPMNKIDDIVSIQIEYKDKIDAILKDINCYLKSRFGKIKKRTLYIGRYIGYHFYFKYEKLPFEVMVRDLKSDTSIEHKIQHSINQKKYYRFKNKG
jgi:hypothetical protein